MKKLIKNTSKIGPIKRHKHTENLNDAEILLRQYCKVFTTPTPIDIFDNTGDFFAEPVEDAALINLVTVISVENVTITANKSRNTNVSLPVASVDNVSVLTTRSGCTNVPSYLTFVTVHVLSVKNVTIPVNNLGDTYVTSAENTSI